MITVFDSRTSMSYNGNNLWHKLSNAGTNHNLPYPSLRKIKLINQYGLIGGMVSFLVFATIHSFLPSLISFYSVTFAATCCSLFFSEIYLNKIGFCRLSGWVMTWITPLFIFIISLIHHSVVTGPGNLAEQEMVFYKVMLLINLLVSVYILERKKLLFFYHRIAPRTVADDIL